MSPPSTKKRKLDPSEDSHIPSKKLRNGSTSANHEPTSSHPPAATSDEIPFTLECPARRAAKAKKKKKKKKQALKDDIFGPEQEDGGFPKIKTNYAIRPGGAWTDLKRFSNFSSKFSGVRSRYTQGGSQTDHSNSVQNQKFSTGSLVYINKHTPPPAPPDPDASEAEVLAFDKANHWVGKVLEVKAANTSEVWLRVFWLYWPEELPKGRQDYHGNQELIMSNHMELVDAKTVTSSADISHWDEKNEDQDVGHRFWRQFYNFQLQGTKTGGLSEIRRHCVCMEYYNPDRTMLKCPNTKCGIWNHQECLEQEILAQTYTRLADSQDSAKINTKFFPESKVARLKSKLMGSSKQNKGKGKGISTGLSSANGSDNSTPWKGLLKADISTGEKGGGGALVAITDERAQDAKTWTEGIQCLKCGTRID